MTRRAYPRPMVRRVQQLHAQGLGYIRCVRAIEQEFGVRIGISTVRDWVTYYTRGAAGD